jgi:hypothetical protein
MKFLSYFVALAALLISVIATEADYEALLLQRHALGERMRVRAAADGTITKKARKYSILYLN